MRTLRIAATAIAAGAVGLVVAGAPAGAAVPLVPAANSQAVGFAGYAVGGAAGAAVTSASTTFTLPSVKCATTGDSGLVALAQIFSSTGTTAAVAGVFVVCESGSLVFQNLLEVNGHSPTTLKFTPAAGNKMTVSVTQTSTGAKVVVNDLTLKKSQTYAGVKGSSSGTDDNSNIGDGGITLNGTSVGNPSFGSISYSNDLTNKVAIGTLPYTAYNEATAATGGTVQILTAKLGKTGNSFKTTFEHA
jgi:hypothetical protein